jgi:hypothetical protein
VWDVRDVWEGRVGVSCDAMGCEGWQRRGRPFEGEVCDTRATAAAAAPTTYLWPTERLHLMRSSREAPDETEINAPLQSCRLRVLEEFRQ